MAGLAELGVVLDRAEVFAVERVGLDAAVAAVGDDEDGVLAAGVDVLAVGVADFVITFPR
jgi:hypothetical protein